MTFIFMSITKKRSSKVLIKKSFPRLFKYINQSFQEGQTSGNSPGRISFACRGYWSPDPSATNLLSLGLSDISSSLLHHSYNIDIDI